MMNEGCPAETCAASVAGRPSSHNLSCWSHAGQAKTTRTSNVCYLLNQPGRDALQVDLAVANERHEIDVARTEAPVQAGGGW